MKSFGTGVGVDHRRQAVAQTIVFCGLRTMVLARQRPLFDPEAISVPLGQDPRIRAAVQAAGGGLSPEPKPPEIDEINFAPRVRIPVLMLNGRYDLFYLADTGQMPLFHLLGSPKRKSGMCCSRPATYLYNTGE